MPRLSQTSARLTFAYPVRQEQIEGFLSGRCQMGVSPDQRAVLRRVRRSENALAAVRHCATLSRDLGVAGLCGVDHGLVTACGVGILGNLPWCSGHFNEVVQSSVDR